MCDHTPTLSACLEGVTENGAPIYAPRTMPQLEAILQHNVSC